MSFFLKLTQTCQNENKRFKGESAESIEKQKISLLSEAFALALFA